MAILTDCRTGSIVLLFHFLGQWDSWYLLELGIVTLRRVCYSCVVVTCRSPIASAIAFSCDSSMVWSSS